MIIISRGFVTYHSTCKRDTDWAGFRGTLDRSFCLCKHFSTPKTAHFIPIIRTISESIPFTSPSQDWTISYIHDCGEEEKCFNCLKKLPPPAVVRLNRDPRAALLVVPPEGCLGSQ
jgi:hypothetical protein